MSVRNTVSNSKELTPARRLGLSRKRSSFGVCKKSEAPDSVTMITKQKKLSLETEDNTSGLENTLTDSQNLSADRHDSDLAKDNVSSVKIKEVENLLSIWKDGSKNSLLYLINLIKERQNEHVNVKMLLKQLRIFETMKFYLADDSDFDCFTSDSEESGC